MAENKRRRAWQKNYFLLFRILLEYLALLFKIISGTLVIYDILVTRTLRLFADVLNFLKCKYYTISFRLTYLYQEHCSIKLIMLLLPLTYCILLITLHSFITLISIYNFIEVYGILALYTQSWIIEENNIWKIKCNFIYIKGIVLTMLQFKITKLKILNAWFYMLPVSLVWCKNKALQKLHSEFII